MNNPGYNQLVSIVIPAYNAARYLSETIVSVINQTYTNWELIVVNDGSKDETLSIAKSFANKDPRIHIIDKSNSGVSDSRNTGIKVAKGDVLFFLDADDVWNIDNITEKIKRLNEPSCHAVYSACEIIDEKSVSFSRFLSGSANLRLEDMLLSKGNYTTAPSGIAVKRNVLDKIGGFDTNLSNNADQDFFIRILATGFKIAYIPDTLWKYRMHGNSMSKNVALLEKDLLYVFNKAAKNNLFASSAFKRRCFANVYTVLAGSWWKNGNNKLKGILYLMKAFFTYPPSLLNFLKHG